MKFIASAFTIALAATIAVGCHNSSPTTGANTNTDTTKTTTNTPDSVLYAFVVLGCNRLSASDTNTQSIPSTANLAQLDRTFTDIAALNPRPNILFMSGDLVLGQGSDTAVLGRELRGWIQHYQASPVAIPAIRLVAVPGNHETQGQSNKLAYAAAEQAWVNNMSAYLAGSNGPGVGGADHLATDQSRLTSSFDYRDSHFVTMNSDPTGGDATVPVNWASADIAAARSAGQKHIFAIAHKPAYSWDGGITDRLTTSNRDSLWSVLEANHVEAMITAHNHVYRRLHPTNDTWMIIAGNGGSSLDSDLPSDQNYGFAVISIMKSGKVLMKEYARNFDGIYNDPCPAATYPTTLRDSADITWQ